MEKTTVLVLAEHDNHHVKSTTHHTVGAALQLSKDITVLVAGDACEAAAKEAASLQGVTRVLLVEHLCFKEGLAENIGALVAELGQSFGYILAPASTFGKNILPRVAAILDVAQISEIMRVVSNDTFVRPIYAGNAQVLVQSNDPIKVMTVRPTAFEAVPVHHKMANIEKITAVQDFPRSHFIRRETHASKRAELTSARVVIAGGRGLQSKENFGLLEEIADKLGGALGASRAAVDAGFVPNDYQVGQTGKVVAPDLYIAVGISGAIQHVAGMKDSKVIVAINKDADAPIFQIADYGLVGDLFQIIPELSRELTAILTEKSEVE